MRIKYLLMIAALAIVAFRFEWPGALDEVMDRLPGRELPSPGVQIVTGRVTVIDGDTLALADRRRIRLFGIDAPESGQTCLDGAGQRYLCGTRAAEALAGLIGRNGQVTCQVRDRDQYQRLVAQCRTEAGIDLNREMVRAGWAIDYVRYSRGLYSAEQREAQIGRQGIWAGSFETPLQWRHDLSRVK
ncbi:thermonuclease family protein [Castellaniella sp.]|uniref:thermonuclease family protein n=1 Tax=Castellaniella sp. TaxID=1955812 RepID=UPI002AFE106F|nr:thermonuclease family protein [Castellaniella sp.]